MSLKSYKVLPMSTNLLPAQFSERPAKRELFIKEHSVRNSDSDKPVGKTLFVINVPPFVTESSFKRAFSTAGAVKNVILQNKPGGNVKGFKTAYVVFEKESALAKALKLEMLELLSTPDHHIRVGLEKWVSEYNNSIYDHSELQSKVNAFMARYDKEEQHSEKQESVDDDGWTIITKKGRNPGLARKESLESRIMEKMKTKAKHKELKNFYTFQIRESKKKHIEELRKKYEADKNKINILKQSRKFKPF